MGISKEQAAALKGNVSRSKHKASFLIGIDPGVNTGVAILNTHTGQLIEVMSIGIIEAMERVKELHRMVKNTDMAIHVFVEDTRKLRLPKHMQSAGRARGAGSVNRDMAIWQEFLEYHQIPHTMCGLSPKEFREGDDAWFRQKTGWNKRTNEHGRCAAGLICGK